MTKKEFYEKLFGQKWFTKENITSLLQDIGKACAGDWSERMEAEINFNEDGIEIQSEVYVPCGRGCCGEWETVTEHIFWEDIAEHFFDEVERDHVFETRERANPGSSNRQDNGL